MFKSVIWCAIALVQVFNISAMAQGRGAIVPVPAGYPYITAQAGNYNIRNEDLSKLYTDLLEKGSIRQQMDRDYILAAVKGLQADYEELVQLITAGAFIKLSQRSKSGETVPSEEFFAAMNEINQKITVVNSRISSVTVINPQTLPSKIEINVGTQTHTVPGFGQIEFGPIIKPFQDNIERLRKQASDYFFKVGFAKSGVPEIINENSGTALNPAFSNQPVMTGVEIEALRKIIKEKRTPTDSVIEYSQNQARQLRRLIGVFVQRYGTDEKYRLRNDKDIVNIPSEGDRTKVVGISIKDYFTQRDAAFKEIVDAFWQRSYLRAKWGIRFCAIQTAKYQQRWLNMDKFLVQTEALRQFREEVACDDSELADAEVNARLIFKVLDERSTQIFEKNSPNILVRANSFMTFLGGRRPSAEAQFMIMQLIVGDIQEEKILNNEGLAKLYEFYGLRYKSTQQNSDYYTVKKCNTDADFTGDQECLNEMNRIKGKTSEGDSLAAFQDVISNAGGGLRATFNDLNGSLQAMTQNIEEANRIEKQLQIALSSSKASQNATSRARRL